MNRMNRNRGIAHLLAIGVIAFIAIAALSGASASSDGQTAGVWDSVKSLFGGSTGNGAPSGAHYNLNIIGVDNPKTANMTGSGHVIFVPLTGKTSISLTPGEFQVLDKNGTDGKAAFQLPVADTEVDVCTTNDDGSVTCGSGTTIYSVFVRALGGKGGSASMTLCGDVDLTSTVDEECSNSSLELNSDGTRKFTNATADLLYLYGVWLDTDGDTVMDTYYKRIPLFSSLLEGYFWDYDNNRLRLAQLRFYDCSTTVGVDSATVVSSACQLTGNN
jgi:hypothetical protein